MNRRHPHPFATGLLRLILACTFIFSGFVKGVDPWGTAIKLDEYFQAFGMDWLSGGRYVFSVLLSTLETVLGLCLLFRIRERAVSTLTLVFMSAFTALTLVIALWNPVSDCGCFGDAVKLTNWQTFYKNVFLLVCAFLLWKIIRIKYHPPLKPAMIEGSMVFLFVLFSAGVGIYAMRHLPPIDFLPFKTGINIPSQMEGGLRGDIRTTLIYRDRTTGLEHEFTLSDTVWYDTLRWEFVDTRNEEIRPRTAPTIREFAVFNQQEDITSALLHNPKETFVITLTDPQFLSESCRDRLGRLTAYAQKNRIALIGVTAAPLPENGELQLGETAVPLYNIDATTLKTMIRAHEGVLLLKEGTLLAKWNCQDIPDFAEEYGDQMPLPAVLQQAERTKTIWLIGVLLAALILTYTAYFMHRRRE